MALSTISPVAQTYMTHEAPSVQSPGSAKRNTVHWDKHNLDQNIKENNIPNFRITSPRLQSPGSRSAASPCQDALADLRDWKLRGQYRRPQIAAETFVAPEALENTLTETNTDLFGGHSLVKAARQLDDGENVFEKHKEQQFEWVLSLSAFEVDRYLEIASDSGALYAPGESDRRYFGCNLLDWTKSAGSENRPAGHPEERYILLATPIDLQADQIHTSIGDFSTHRFQLIKDQTRNTDMAVTQPTNTSPGATGSTHRPSTLSATSARWSTAAEVSEDSDNTLTIDPHREMKAPLSTLEDSFEQLDQFEDDIEAIATAASQLSLLDSQATSARVSKVHQTPSPSQGARQASSASHAAERGQWSVDAQKIDSLRGTSGDAPIPVAKSDQDTSQKQPKGILRKVARPASLAPPKPIQKANKQPTIPTFELPGERVARELKEKKAARLSMQVEPQKNVEANPPHRTRSIRSSKPPTIANFELPGERYSRQKKERFEQKLREEEEEARRRRQFKARPPPSTAAPTVRSTFTSRQRQNTGQLEQGSPYSPPTAEFSPKSGASKRQSVTMTPSTARTVSISTASTVSVTGRGRTSSNGSTKASTRATSSSVSSVASSRKRSSISAEDIQQQKARGRQIYNRDSTTGRSKEQEKRDREEAIKLARQKYAQMSRNLAASSRARQTQQQSSSAEHEATDASPKGVAPQVPKHKELYLGKNF